MAASPTSRAARSGTARERPFDLPTSSRPVSSRSFARTGRFPLRIGGDGLFAAFAPGDPTLDVGVALAACAPAVKGVDTKVNTWLARMGKQPIQARGGRLRRDHLRSFRQSRRERGQSDRLRRELRRQMEKAASSWEVAVGEGMAQFLPCSLLTAHRESPKRYACNGLTRTYPSASAAGRPQRGPVAPRVRRARPGRPRRTSLTSWSSSLPAG
jgi:hypothetical protein